MTIDLPASDAAMLLPREGLTVRDPDTREALPAAGALKTLSAYWHRRILDGDVTVADSAALRLAAAEGDGSPAAAAAAAAGANARSARR